MAMAMAGFASVFASQPAVRCNAEPCFPSTSAANSSGATISVKFPARQPKIEPVENVNVSSSHSGNGNGNGSERPAILDPALWSANLMWFKGSYNTQIFVSEDEPADSVVRRFRKAVMQVWRALFLVSFGLRYRLPLLVVLSAFSFVSENCSTRRKVPLYEN